MKVGVVGVLPTQRSYAGQSVAQSNSHRDGAQIVVSDREIMQKIGGSQRLFWARAIGFSPA